MARCVLVGSSRFLVHRYSVLQQHAEAQGLDEPLDSNHTQTSNVADFHDDSDEVMLP